MAEVIRMPKMSDTMTEGVIAEWHKKVGDKIKSGDILADVETDKATMELENFEDGVLLYIGIENGQAAPVDAIIAIVGKEGEDFKSLLGGDAKPAKEEAPAKVEKPVEAAPQVKADAVPAVTKAEETAKAEPPDEGDSDESRVKASPLAKKIAEEKGIDIAKVQGSGDGGRIIKKDVEAYTPAAQAPAASKAAMVSASDAYEEVAVSQMRKTIAKRLAESKFSAPHFYLTIEIEMGKAMEARTKINAIAPTKVSFNDLVVKAAAVALKQHPKINSSWLGDKIRINHQVNVGVAMAVEDGLLVPVVKNADQKSLSTIAAEVKVYSGKAKDKKLQPADWEGNTFTISNLGMMGIEEFTAIINPPDACIMAVGSIVAKPVVVDGSIVIGNRMKVTLSCDHRVVDGASGAAFLATFKDLLEDPIRMLV